MDDLQVKDYSQQHTVTANQSGQFQKVTRVQFNVYHNGNIIARYSRDFPVGRDDTAAITSDGNSYVAELRNRMNAITGM